MLTSYDMTTYYVVLGLRGLYIYNFRENYLKFSVREEECLYIKFDLFI